MGCSGNRQTYEVGPCRVFTSEEALTDPRINSDDCDALMPSTQDVLGELDQLTPDLRQTFIPSELPTLVDLWINLLNLTLRVEVVLSTVYRVRRPTLTQATLEQQDRDIWLCKFTTI